MKPVRSVLFNAAVNSGFRAEWLGGDFGECLLTPKESPVHITDNLRRFALEILEYVELYGAEYVGNEINKER